MSAQEEASIITKGRARSRRQGWRVIAEVLKTGNRGVGYVPPEAEYPNPWRRVGWAFTHRRALAIARGAVDPFNNNREVRFDGGAGE